MIRQGHMKNCAGFGLSKLLMTLLLAGLIIILSSVVDFSKPLPSWRLPAAGAVIGFILLLCRFRVGKISLQAILLLFFWLGYATMSVASAIVSNDNIVGELWQLVGVPLVFFFVIPHYTNKHGVVIIAMAMALGYAPFILTSLILHPIQANYEGIYANPNAMGMVAATWMTGLLILVRGYTMGGGRTLAKTFISILLGLSILVGLGLLVASSSRTSLITIGMLFFIFVWTLLLDASKKRFWIVLVITGTSLLLMFMLVTGGARGGGMLAEQMKKFDSSLGSVSGREVIWQTVLKETSIFGYGNSNLERRLGEPAHNTHMEVLHAKGSIGLIFRVFFDIMVIKMTYRLAVRKVREDGYAVGPFMMIMTYMVMGLTENVNGTLGSGIHMAFLLMIGMALNYDENN